MKKTAIFMAAMLAVAAVFAAGLTILPSTVQDAQASQDDINDICEDNNTGSGDNDGRDSQVKCEDFYGVFQDG